MEGYLTYQTNNCGDQEHDCLWPYEHAERPQNDEHPAMYPLERVGYKKYKGRKVDARSDARHHGALLLQTSKQEHYDLRSEMLDLQNLARCCAHHRPSPRSPHPCPSQSIPTRRYREICTTSYAARMPWCNVTSIPDNDASVQCDHVCRCDGKQQVRLRRSSALPNTPGSTLCGRWWPIRLRFCECQAAPTPPTLALGPSGFITSTLLRDGIAMDNV